jgi:hypothetical protein
MRYRDDPILQAKAGKQPAREPQQGSRRRVLGALGAPWYPRQTDTDGSAHGFRLVLGLVALGFILGIVGYLVLNH